MANYRISESAKAGRKCTIGIYSVSLLFPVYLLVYKLKIPNDFVAVYRLPVEYQSVV